jgi:glycosyltransferase involved in cell wall biosynthesis
MKKKIARKFDLIVVLGMHRSGTSAITRGLEVLGVELGDNLMSPMANNNSKGFFEDLDVVDLNTSLLNHLGLDWHYASPVTDSQVDDLIASGYLLKAADLMRRKIACKRPYGIKDPRLAKLIPFWKKVFKHCEINVGYIIVVRNPISVTKSLNKRDGLTSEKGYMLWLDHVLTPLLNTENTNRIAVDFDLFIENPAKQLGRISKTFDLSVNSEAMSEYVRKFLDQELRHYINQPQDLAKDPQIPQMVRDLYAMLRTDASMDQPFTLSYDQINYFTSVHTHLHAPFVYIDQLNQAVADRDGQLATLNQTVAERDEQIATMNQAVADRDGQMATLNQTVAERDEQMATLNQAVEQREAQIDDLEQKITKLSEQAEALEHIVESAKKWQKKSWAKRAFHRWREPNANRKKTKFLTRLSKSIRKQKKNRFGLNVMNNLQSKSFSTSLKWNQQKPIKNIAFHKAGKPRGWVRFLFFHKNRKPRQIFKRIACKKSGAPRPVFADWMNDNEALHGRACPVDNRMREIAARFYAEEYLKLNADVHLAGVDPLTHYIKHGIEESRLINKEDIDLESITTSISVVIPTHNRADTLENTIQALFDCGEGLNIEVVVVNDGSQDHTEEVLQRIQSKQPSLRYLTIPNQGAGVARNHGAAAAKNDIILFMGDDILPANRNFLAAHARYHQNHDKNNFAVLGKVDWPPDNIFEITPVMRHIQGPGGEQFGYADMQPHKPWDWRFFYTCNVSVKRNIVDNWLNEGFSPAFTGCCFEDAEFAYRMNKKYGIFPILYIDESVGHHYHRHTVSTFLRRQHFAGAMAKVLGDLHPDALVSVGFGPVQQAFMTKSPQSLPSIYSNLALAESIFSWAQSLEENGLLGTENWHKELLHCVFRISAFLGYIDNAGTTSSNHSSAIEYVIDLSCSPLIEALPKKYWREQGYI